MSARIAAPRQLQTRDTAAAMRQRLPSQEQSNEKFTYAFTSNVRLCRRGKKQRVRSVWLLYAATEHHARDELFTFTIVAEGMVRSGWRAIHSLWHAAAGWRGSS